MTLPKEGLCLDHESRIKRNTYDINKLDKEINGLHEKRENAVRRVHKRIDIMQWSVVCAMFIVVVQGVFLVVEKFVK